MVDALSYAEESISNCPVVLDICFALAKNNLSDFFSSSDSFETSSTLLDNTIATEAPLLPKSSVALATSRFLSDNFFKNSEKGNPDLADSRSTFLKPVPDFDARKPLSASIPRRDAVSSKETPDCEASGPTYCLKIFQPHL